MVVEGIRARKKERSRTVDITFTVHVETYLNMTKNADAGCHPDTLDYIAGRLNLVFIDDASRTQKPKDAQEEVRPSFDGTDGIPF
ncbi:hypothetical protein SAMN05216196_1154 [Lutimaribacter pacificus]|uniref:Uncharacterized protein n=1 Tax=Lutimaribacter pacificus TaxID=391948 RepID=A0A1H0NZJ3_9RHOB|nr:hypothetical protein [Lutimaribacter pacificus]SDO98029.1 hypothetical protein SAMN05216196_1154 [Lutimaribacter pacificus]SHK97232.1 hypothetical protein SAMN05444142_1153 [Lutimaribacter pacificus]